MKELHNSEIQATNLEPKEGQRVLLCSNKAFTRCPSFGTSPLSKDTLNALRELGDILKPIRKRMLSQGYEVINGRIQKKYFKKNKYE